MKTVLMRKPTRHERGLLKKYKESLVLSQELLEIGIGGLLGDVSIQSQDGGRTFRLKYSQSDKKHRRYLFHLYHQWEAWVLSPPRFDEKRKQWTFQTISHEDLHKLARLFILDGKGRICKKYIYANLVEDYLTPRALAYWFMDDGEEQVTTRPPSDEVWSLIPRASRSPRWNSFARD